MKVVYKEVFYGLDLHCVLFIRLLSIIFTQVLENLGFTCAEMC